MQTAFKIHASDNVATALSPLIPGEVRLNGDVGQQPTATAAQEIPMGHKFALTGIAVGEMIVKYGVPIGRATKDIPAGSWVHLHVMCSNYDERSSHLDEITGAPKDTLYE